MKLNTKVIKKTHHIALLFAVSLMAGGLIQASNVVTDWNAIASTTIVKNAAKPAATATVWFAYSSIAVYDAVNSITKEFRPFYYRGDAPQDASVETAAVAAAHRVLVNYFPEQTAALDWQFEVSLSAIKAGARAKKAGVAVGEASAAALISARTGDGLEADVTYTSQSSPGAWIPTPPGFLPPLAPWLGKMRPFTTSQSAELVLQGPTPLSSVQWVRDFNLTRLFGDANSTIRPARETEIGIYWTENAAQQYARAFGYLAENYHLSLSETARLMAILWTGSADAFIACFEAKYRYGFWRPVTAIEAGGDNADLNSDSSWTPLGITPNHPEYPSGHATLTGAVSNLIAGYFGTTKVHIVTDSVVFPDGLHQHTFEDTRDLFDEVFWARIYAGFHFYHSLQDGGALGATIADDLLQHHFKPRCGYEQPSGETVEVRR